jgi:hypothetical protein
MDVDPEKEDLFNEVYDTEHVPNLLKVPGVHGVTRLRTETAHHVLAGQVRELTGDGAPKYVAIYEIDSPGVLEDPAWSQASEKGRWATEVRPYTRNRHHIVRSVL